MSVIAVLRSGDDNNAYRTAIERAGFESLIEPILTIDFISADVSSISADAPLVFTSSNGVRAFAHVSGSHRANPVFTVGTETAIAARACGFTDVRDAGGTVSDLEELVATAGLRSPPVYIRGEAVARDLRLRLKLRGIELAEIILYRAVPAERLSPALRHALERRTLAAAMFFSARGARNFTALLTACGLTDSVAEVKALCIGHPVLQSVSVLPFRDTMLASSPDRRGMIGLIEQLEKPR